MQKVKEKAISHCFAKVLCDLIVNSLVVYVILFGQAVLSMFCAGTCVYNEQLACAHVREDSVFYSAHDQTSFCDLLHVYLRIIPRRQYKGKRQKNKEREYFAQAHPKGCDCRVDCHHELAVMISSLSGALQTRLLCPLGNMCPRRPSSVVFPEPQSFNCSGQLVDPGRQGNSKPD